MRIFVVMAGLFTAVSVVTAGCGSPAGRDHDEEKVVARINDYELTVADFRYEADMTLANKYLSGGTEKIRETLLDEIITKKVLLQEAQERGLDKKKLFMKEIEGYWEQSLLKLLFKEKLAAIDSTIVVSEEELKEMYERRKRKVYGELIILGEKALAEKLASSGDMFDEIKKRLTSMGKVKDEQVEWWMAGDLPEALEETLFSLEPGQASAPAMSSGNWVVLRMLKDKTRTVKPFGIARASIKEEIAQRERNRRFEAWLEGLRQKARIEINEDVLNDIDIERKE